MYFFSKNKKGMSLIEMIVAIGIFSLGILGFSELLIKSWRSNAFIYEQGQTAFATSRAIQNTVNDLRRIYRADSYPIDLADDNELIVYIDVEKDGVIEKVHYFFEPDNQLFRRGISKPNGANPVTYPSTDEEIGTIASFVVNDEEHPIFTYYARNTTAGTVLTTPMNSNTNNNSRESIGIIRVHVMENIDPFKAPDNINIESFVELRNLKYYVQ
jgi:prepilin-type N-terminal cleavage/methylation domain-containing protein